MGKPQFNKKSGRDEKAPVEDKNKKARTEALAKEKQSMDDQLKTLMDKYRALKASEWTVDQLLEHLESAEIKGKSEKTKSLIFTAVRAIGGAKPAEGEESEDDFDFLGEEGEEFPFFGDEEDLEALYGGDSDAEEQ